ncbi:MULTISPECIES: 50S ribosomal protein L25/general stress protein Ctc [Mycetocola]|uniref:50S ribosomal protein L25/general stress protein Ctc n=1 Tax=Mycetocola TaxID=76634 RepID=UPI00165D26E0|nr:50S ribosomal protein L25/general stress protein Ctc [Mycetocola sp. JXN-3]
MADNSVNLDAELRTSFGKGAARKLRAAGKIPAVIYGHGTEPKHVSLPTHATGLIVRHTNALINLNIEGTEELVLVREVQKDPVLRIIEHIDLAVVVKGEKVEVEIPVHVEGDAAPGTLANIETNTLRLLVAATNIPASVVVSIAGAEEGQHVHAKDVVLPEGAELVDDADLLIVQVAAAPAAAAEEETEAAAE